MPPALPRLALSLVVLAFAACDCGGGTGSVTAGFRTRTTELDFGKVLEGAQVSRQVELESTGRGEVTVAVSVTGPFRAPESVVVPGGATVPLEVTFTAPADVATGTLTLSARGETFEMALRGRGVRPLECLPSAQCLTARFVLETESCEESTATDGTTCIPEDVCLENGVCRSGSCVGTPRTCNDGNACTQDACAPDRGCVHVDVSSACPRPGNPCERATCDPLQGCGTAVVDDGNPCGAVNCVTANLCQGGVCRSLPTPEGFLCAPPTPCQGEGRCSQQECRRPDAGELTPAWNLPVGAPLEPVTPAPGRMLALNGNLYFAACGLTSQDGGCALTSFTGNGFLRFDAPSPTLPTLHAVSPHGALIEQGGALQSFAVANGAPRWSVPLGSLALIEDGGTVSLPRGALTVEPDGGALLLALSTSNADGGEGGVVLTALLGDGGLQSSEAIPDAGVGSVLARGSSGTEWLYGDGVALSRMNVDGGWTWTSHGTLPGNATLSAVGGGGASFGGSWLVTADGGVVSTLDAGELPIAFEPLSASGTAFVFYEPPTGPWLSVRALTAASGAELWTQPVLPPSLPGQLVEAALTGGPLSGGVLTLTQGEPTEGVRLDLQLFAFGQRLLQCPLPQGARAYAAAFEQGSLYVLVEREGAWRLEAYDLAGIPLSTQGWPRSSGVSGQRTER